MDMAIGSLPIISKFGTLLVTVAIRSSGRVCIKVYDAKIGEKRKRGWKNTELRFFGDT